VQGKRPQLVRRIKELQPEASNRAIAEAIGVAPATVDRDIHAASYEAKREAEAQGMLDRDDPPASHEAPELDDEPDEEDMEVGDDDETDEPEDTDDQDEEELPEFLCGEGWTMRERAHAYALYLGLPAPLQPTIDELLGQPGICPPDIVTMLEHIATMDGVQHATLTRLQTSTDAYDRSCAITMAMGRPPMPHPRLTLLRQIRAEVVALRRQIEGCRARVATDMEWSGGKRPLVNSNQVGI
jgi:hypothetical protein